MGPRPHVSGKAATIGFCRTVKEIASHDETSSRGIQVGTRNLKFVSP